MTADAAARDLLARALDWSEAHTSFDDAVDGLPAHLRGVRPAGLAHSAWEIVEHIRIAQRDILDFAVAEAYEAMDWPADYWPKSPAPPDPEAWARSIDGVKEGREGLRRLVADPRVDLAAASPHGAGGSLLRAVLLAADHAAYHVGQLVIVRRLLGAWPAA